MASEPLTPAPRVLSVSQLNRLARDILETSFPLFWVSGEISNLTRAASGHWYFSLKDDKAQVRCVMFRGRNAALDWLPREGDHVEARALVTLYEARGDFQLQIEFLQRAGLGALFEAFERLKAKLEQEGLFAADRKRKLPAHPRQVGIVTSADAAALHDILTTLRRRASDIPVILYPTPVQGKTAGQQIAAAIRTASARNECDVLLVCRGGGSIEDLWSFNEEIVARAIADCAIPVVSGVGHDTDFTIADFVADVRAPTPTAAAELVSPDRAVLLRRTRESQARLRQQGRNLLAQRSQQLDYLSRRLISPAQQTIRQQMHLMQVSTRLRRAVESQRLHSRMTLQQLARRLPLQRPETAMLGERLARHEQQLVAARDRHLRQQTLSLTRVAQSLQHLNPERVLQRGYALVRAANGDIVRDSRTLTVDDMVELKFALGSARARVTRTETPEN